MTQRILVLEKNEEVAGRLREALARSELAADGLPVIVSVRSMRETLMAIDRGDPYDLAIIPLENAVHQVRPIRALQPGLPIFVTTATAGNVLPPESIGHFQGLIYLPQLESEIPRLMAGRNFGEPPDTAAPAKRRSFQLPDRETVSAFVAFLVPRLASYILILLSIIFLTYLGLDLASGADFWPAVQDAFVNTIDYVQRLLHGDLGTTTTASGTVRPIPVEEVLAIWLPRSLGLIAISLLFASVAGLILGIRAATRGSGQSLSIIVVTIIGVSVPSFFAAFLLQKAVISVSRWSGQTLLPVGGFGWDNHLVLPVLVLAARPLAQITRITYVSVADVIREDYVRTARSKGLRQFQVIGRHVMGNAAIPILTTIGVSLRFILTSLPVVELYFGWLGGGFLLLKGISQQDENLTIALVLCLGILFIVVNFLLEISYRLIDPRLRDQSTRVSSRQQKNLHHWLKSTYSDLVDFLRDNAIVNRIKQWRREPVESPFKLALERSGILLDDPDRYTTLRQRPLWRVVLGNTPLLVGGILVALLIFVVLFGPKLASNSPFTTVGFLMIDGKLTPPPFAPNETYPWGTDALGRGMMSLILTGAQQTLVLAALAVTARMAVGVLLGAVAGWTSGSRLDRLIVGAAEIIAAYPTLLLVMILILAIGIRQGMSTFIIALCVVGWAETMQYVRSEVMSIRPKPFIESAIATGARTPRIITRHIMPILFSSLISIAALEMGSVLMLLGELGFISIFIGGGALIELTTQTLLYSDVPEWGALLSNVRYLAGSYPWTALYPMLAFFIAVLSFNLFGEGIRRLVAQGHLVINRFFNRYTVALSAIAVLGLIWLRMNMGAMPFYREFAREFDGDKAMSHVTALTDPTFAGRALGSEGPDKAADAVAAEFEALGLQAGGQKSTFFQERKHAFQFVNDYPTLTIEDGGAELEFGRDFAVYPSQVTSLGQANAPVRFVGLGKASPYQAAGWRLTYPDLEWAKFSNDILLTFSDREADILQRKEKAGLLVVTDDPEKLAKRYTTGGIGWGETTPRLWISEETAERILASSGYSVEGLRDQIGGLPPEELLDLPLDTTVGMKVAGHLEERWPVRHVIGYMPGTSGKERCTICLGEELVVVMAQYDSPVIGPDGAIHPAANNNASGVALMLEIIRTFQETDYQPYRSFLFVAYSGEGLDGGVNVSDPDVQRFLQAKTGFTEFKLEAIVHLRGVGDGSGNRLEISAGGSLRLADLFETGASQMGIRSKRAADPIDIGVVFEDGQTFGIGGQEAPIARIGWEGWDEHSRLPSDTEDKISAEKLEKAGQAITLSLMVLGREQNY